MTSQIFVINTLEDTADFAGAVVSFRKAIELAITYAQETQMNETIEIKFDESLFDGNMAIVELESTVEIPAEAFGAHPVIFSAPADKTVVISAPQSVTPIAVASGNDVTYVNVMVETLSDKTLPEETLSEETLSEETLSEETLSEETLSEETLSEETLSAETPKFAAMAMPAATAPVNVDHIYVNPDYTDAELDDAHYRTIADAVGAHPDYNGSITVELAGATTTIGALTMQAKSKVFGGALVSGGTVTANSALIVDVPSGQSASYGSLFGGCMVSGGTVTGNSSLTIGGEGTISVAAAFGGIYLTGGTTTAVVMGASSLSISAGTFSNVVCGGHIIGGTSTVIKERNNSCTLTISDGVFLREVAAGCYNQGGKLSARNVTNQLMISGGTFYASVYGGNIAKTQALATAVNNASPIDMTVNSTASVTIDSSVNTVTLLKNVVLGSRYQGKIQGNCQMTFSGIAENLVLDKKTIVVGDSESANDDDHRINGARSLVFDGYRSSGSGAGDFSPLDLLAFDRITFTGESYVGFNGDGKGGDGYDLSAVNYWTFQYGSTLEWTKGTNDFYADALTISLNGQSVKEWTIMTGNDDTLCRWDWMGLNDAYPVTIDGTKAIWDSANNWYATSEYKIYREGNSLKLATLA